MTIISSQKLYKCLLPYSGYIPSQFNFVLLIVFILCGMNIFQMKKTFSQCHVCKMVGFSEQK